MKKVLELTKVFLKTSFSNMNSQMGIKTKNKIGIVALYIFLIVYLGGLIGIFSYNIIELLKTINQESIFIGLILLITIGFTLFQSIFSSINVLYFTKDSEYILPLPLKPSEIILSRTIVILVMEYFVEAMISLIPLILYGVLTGMGVMYYITMAIALILIPILPVVLISTIVMIVMSFSKLVRNKNKFQIVATIIVLIFSVAFGMLISSTNGEVTDEQMMQMIMQANSMVNLIDGYFPTLSTLITALTSTSVFEVIVAILETIGISVIALIIYLFIAEKIYLKGLVGNLFSGNSKKSKVDLNKNNFNNSKLYKSYVGKEFKILLRNPIFLMQCFIPAILIPILMIGIVALNFRGIPAEEFQEVTSLIPNNTIVVVSVILGIVQFFYMFSYISITAISRDGENAVFMKYVPVSLYKQYIYKIIPNFIMNIFTVIVTLAILQFILKMPIITLLIVFVISMIMNAFQSILMLVIDLKKPKLNWDSEYSVVKQNMNLMYPMLLSMVNIGILVLITIITNSLNVYIGSGIILVVYGLLTYFVNRYLYKNQVKLADNII